jgi:hypothetical protein
VKSPHTLITGCTLYILAEGKCLHGDLHVLDSTFIFNGVLHHFDAAWMYGDEAVILRNPQTRVVLLRAGSPYFERRGVVVFDRQHADFNACARAFLATSPYFQEN